jgi:hypothetical protein
MTLPTTTQGWRLRAAIARDQTTHWRRMFWAPARTKRELARREQLWFWWGGIGFLAEMEAKTLAKEKVRSGERER